MDQRLFRLIRLQESISRKPWRSEITIAQWLMDFFVRRQAKQVRFTYCEGEVRLSVNADGILERNPFLTDGAAHS